MTFISHIYVSHSMQVSKFWNRIRQKNIKIHWENNVNRKGGKNVKKCKNNQNFVWKGIPYEREEKKRNFKKFKKAVRKSIYISCYKYVWKMTGSDFLFFIATQIKSNSALRATLLFLKRDKVSFYNFLYSFFKKFSSETKQKVEK